MTTRNGFVRRHTAGYADDSICPYCFLTVSTVQGGANLLEMEMRHRCDPMTKVESPQLLRNVASTGKGSAYLSAPDTTSAEQEEILRRLKKYGRKQGLAIVEKETGNKSPA